MITLMTDIEHDNKPETFPLMALIGKRVTDVLSAAKYDEEYALYFGDCVVVLDDGLRIEMPYSISDEAIVAETPAHEASELAGLSVTHGGSAQYLQGRVITDLIQYPEDDPDRAFFELDNGYLFGQVMCTQPGTGYPGAVLFRSLAELEKRHGRDYTRLVHPDGPETGNK